MPLFYWNVFYSCLGLSGCVFSFYLCCCFILFDYACMPFMGSLCPWILTLGKYTCAATSPWAYANLTSFLFVFQFFFLFFVYNDGIDDLLTKDCTRLSEFFVFICFCFLFFVLFWAAFSFPFSFSFLIRLLVSDSLLTFILTVGACCLPDFILYICSVLLHRAGWVLKTPA